VAAIRRALPLWLALLAIYGVAQVLDGGVRTAPEAHILLTAESIVSDGDLDLRDEYRSRVWRDFASEAPRPTASLTGGRLHEPQGIGFPLLLAPAYAAGGAVGAELLLAALLAAAFCLAAALGRLLVPEPWASRAALVAGVSPPALDAGTSIAPEAAGAAALAAAVLLALRVRERPRLRWTFWSATLASLLPWLTVKLVIPGIVVALALFRWLRRRQRSLAGFVALEAFLTSAVVYLTMSERLFDGLVPGDAALPGGSPYDGVELPWDLAITPFAALAGVGAWRIWRSHRERWAVAVHDQVDVQVAGGFMVAAAVAAMAATVVAQPWTRDGHELIVALPVLAPVCALGWQRTPRAGAALAVLTVALSAAALAGL
jgi:hypothetical protein